MSFTIAVWSNNGESVAFDSGKYRYEAELPEETVAKHLQVVRYNPGCHRHSLKNLRKNAADFEGQSGVYIHKQNKIWVSIGKIVYADVPEEGDVSLWIESTHQRKLATNKRDALTILGYTKQLGKGTGTLMMGVCRIQPIECLCET